jgi:hypothetical protein
MRVREFSFGDIVLCRMFVHDSVVPNRHSSLKGIAPDCETRADRQSTTIMPNRGAETTEYFKEVPT